MSLPKKKREELRNKFGGKCAYCGHELNARWQADHVKPVLRIHKWVKKPGDVYSTIVPTGEMENPENDCEENLFPACSACNNNKGGMPLEDWRKHLESLPGVCERNHSAYRHALRFGLVESKPKPVVFYFEKFIKKDEV